VVKEVVDSISHFKQVAQPLDAKAETIRLIEKQLNQTWQDNKHLLD
jgi:hypothetical protein